jgi:hypothetical protein
MSASGALASAQGVPVLRRGNIDIIGFGASSFGSGLGGITVSSTGVPITNGSFTLGAPSNNGGGGVRVSAAVTRRVRLYGEWAYTAGSRNNFSNNYINTAGINPGDTPTTYQVTLSAQTSFQEGLGGLEWLFPIRRFPHVVPYVDVGVGVIALGGGANASVIGGAPTTGANFSVSIQGRHFIGSGGVGVCYYFTERAGLRLELDGVFGPQSHGNAEVGAGVVTPNGATHLGQFVYGFFYQIH